MRANPAPDMTATPAKQGRIEEPFLLTPERRHPYYIVTPPYTRMSAGIKALHLLCHALNRVGQNAFVWPHYPKTVWSMPVNPDLLTPLLTPAIIEWHREQGTTPIVVYPEIVPGNPLRAPLAVRYILNYPGLLGGDAEFASSELKYAYSAKLATASGVSPDRILFVPVSDTSVFHPNPRVERKGSCFFASKYQEFHDGKLFDITRDSVEITRHRHSAQTPEQIAELFRRSEVFYTYENTALAIEAMLCECPTVFLPNPHLTEVIAAEELGCDGFAWGTDPAEIQRAKETVGRAHHKYLQTYAEFWKQLREFIATTQEAAEKTPYLAPICVDRPWHEEFLRKFGAYRKPRRLVALVLYIAILIGVAYFF